MTRRSVSRRPALLGWGAVLAALVLPLALAAQQPPPPGVPDLPPGVSQAQVNAAARAAGFENSVYPYYDVVDGCGAGPLYHLIPDGPGYGVSFVPACDEHDRCYMGGPDRGSCDREFHQHMRRICDAAGLPSVSPAREPRPGLSIEECHQSAASFHLAVDQWGSGVYAASQVQQRIYAGWLRSYLSPGALVLVFDVSGSMAQDGRHALALSAAEAALDARSGADGDRGAAGIVAFGGGCDAAGVRIVSEIRRDLPAVRRLVRTIPAPAGATPLRVALGRVREVVGRYRESRPDAEFEVVLLSDGADTCGGIRPPGVYGAAASAPAASGGGAGARYLTVGLAVEPGSPAERDLQYLATSSGGRYVPAAEASRLRHILERQVRTYVPRPVPAAAPPHDPAAERFFAGVLALQSREYGAAAGAFAAFVAAHPDDAAGHYNRALATEAGERFRAAAASYARYLELAPDAPDAAELRRRLPGFEGEAAARRQYLRATLGSDLAYLTRYYDQLFHRPNRELAAEFAGFVREKASFYADFAGAMEMEEAWLERLQGDLVRSLERLARRVDTPTFDRDAVSLLTVPIGHMEEMLRRLPVEPRP